MSLFMINVDYKWIIVRRIEIDKKWGKKICYGSQTDMEIFLQNSTH